MELPPSSHDTSNAPFTLTLHDPSTYPTQSLTHRWQSLVMLANLPHVEVLLTVIEGNQPQRCMLMLDSGAGGVDAMFHARAVQELGLAQASKHGIRTLTVRSRSALIDHTTASSLHEMSVLETACLAVVHMDMHMDPLVVVSQSAVVSLSDQAWCILAPLCYMEVLPSQITDSLFCLFL